MTEVFIVGAMLCLSAGIITLVRCWADRPKRKPWQVPEPQVITVPPRYVIWARCDTNKGAVSSWEPAYMGDDLHQIWNLAQREFPIETFDLLPLPNGEVPEGP